MQPILVAMFGNVFRRPKASKVLVRLAALLCMSGQLPAQGMHVLPQGGTFAAGTGAIGSAVNGSLGITQNSARGIINWNSFSIGAGGRVFIRNGNGATLNRVLGGDLSRIDGLLGATGSVYLINPNGIVIGPKGAVLTGGSFVASTRDTSDSGFLAVGNMSFDGKSGGGVINLGSILSRDGNVLLIGNSVENSGSISAANGTATLASGNNVLLTTLNGPSGIYVAPDSAATGSITQTGRIAAAAVALQAAGGNIYTLAGNRSGLISATGAQNIDGQIWLTAPNGTVSANGIMTAANADGSGGRIAANGGNVNVGSNAVLSAQGTRGGIILIGTSAAGGSDLANNTWIANGASILAGGGSGGGSIETSGHNFSLGHAHISAGKGGSWLVDPIDLTIDSTAASAIETSLNSGTNVTEQTTASTASGAGVQTAGNGDINVAAPITWTGSGALTLSAYNNLNINAAVSGAGNFTGTAGGAVAANASVSAANVLLSATGNVALASGVQIAGASGATLETQGQFINNAGASALSGGIGNWLVYSTNPTQDTTGGLTPNFIQYAANAGATPSASGNGLLYSVAPSLSVALSGTVEKAYDGTTTASFSSSNASVSGLINGDTATVSGHYANKNAGSGINVTASNITVENGAIPVYGYAGTSPSVSANIGQIDKAQLTAAIVGDPTKTYNGTTTAELTSSNYQLSGFASGEGATVNQPSSVAYDSVSAGGRTVSATFSATNFAANNGTSLSNYVLPTSATGAGTINPAPLLITGVVATDKTYDGSAADTLNTAAAALYGIIGSDNVNLVTGSATGTFASSNAGANQAVSALGFYVTGSKASDYTLVQPQGLTATINQAALSITGVSANSKTYDGTIAATLNTSGATLSGVIAGDALTLNTASATAAFSSADAGTSLPVTASNFGISGTAAANYKLSQPTGLSADIYAKALAASITATPTKTYNGDAGAVVNSSGFSITGFLAGQSAAITQTAHLSYASANAGTQNVTATLAPSDYLAANGTKLSNYILPTSATGTGTINPAPVSISLVGNPTKVYDGNALATLSSSNFLLTGFLSGEGATVNQTTGTYDSANAGSRSVTATIGQGNLTAANGTILSNYSFPTSVSGFGTITPAPLTGEVYAAITGNPTKTYDGTTVATLTSSDFTLTGFFNGDGATVTQTNGTYASKNVGVQPVTATLTSSDFAANSGTNLSNYTLPTMAYGSGTINPALLTISISGNPTKVYNGTTTATLAGSAFSVSGLASGEGITISNNVPATYDSTQAGARTITASLPVTDITAQSGTLLSNYTLPGSAAGSGTISQAPLAILGLWGQNKTYDTTTTATLGGTATLFGVVGSDQVSLQISGSSAAFASANAGTGIAISASGYAISGADSSNYLLAQPTGLSANINRAGLSVSGVTALNKNYDSTNIASLNASSATLNGIFAADSGQVLLDSTNAAGMFSAVNVGNNLRVTANGFSLSGSEANNYYLNQPSGLTADILPAPLTAVIIGNPTKAYDGSSSTTLYSSNYQLLGFAAGQGASVPQSASASYVSANAGTENITSTLVSSDFVANAGTNLANYTLPTTGFGTGTITPAPLAVRIIGNPTKSYDSTTAATLSSPNYQLSGFISGQGGSVTQTSGTYGSANAGSESVSASLSSSDYSANNGTLMSNYQLPTTASGTGTINQALLQVTGVNGTNRVYNGSYADMLDVSNAGVSGLFGSDTVNLNSAGATGVFASKDVGTGISLTASGFAISGGASSNYTLAQPTGLSADISQATLSLTKVARVYDGTTSLPNTSSNYTLSGLYGSDSVSVDTTNISGNYADKNVGTGKDVTLSGLALTGAQAGDYTVASSLTNAAIGQITPAALTVANAQAQNKVYDATTAAAIDNSFATLSGLFGADDVALNTSAVTGVFSDKNVGTNKSVTASGYTISGADMVNYTLTQPTGLTANITPYSGISLASIAKVYDGASSLPTSSSAYTLSGLLGSDSVQVNTSGISGSYATTNVGTGLSISLSGLALTGSAASNYSISSTLLNDGIGIITPRALTAAIIGTPTKTYDTTAGAALTSSNYSLSGFASGQDATITKTSGTYASANAGSRAVSTTLAAGDFTANGGTLLSNYTLPTTASGGGYINKAPLTVNGVAATNKMYNGTTADTLNTSSAALSGVLGSDTVTLGSAGVAGTFASANAGSNITVTATGFTIGGSSSGNYTLSQPTGLSASILQAILSLASVTKMYDATTSAVGAGLSYTLSGIEGSDSVSLNTSGLSGTFAAKNVGTGLSVSMSGLSLTGSKAGNYSINPTVTDVTIGTITKAPLTVTGAVAVNKTYDGTTAAIINDSAAALSGVLGADIVAVTSPTSGTFASANAGTWAVTASSNYTISGTDAGNYTLTQPTGFSATINRAPLLASIINNPAKTYDATNAATLGSTNYSLAGLIGSQSATVNQTSGSYDTADAGSRTVSASLSAGNFTAGSGTSLSNYILPTTATGAGTIDQKTLNASIINDPSKTYDATTAASLVSSNYALTGFVGSQGATVSQTSGAYASANAGNRTVTALLSSGNFTANSGTNLANYVLPTSASGIGSIDQKLLSAAITGDPTKTYDATTTATLASSDYTLSGFAGSEGAIVTQSSGVYASANAGSENISTTLGTGNFTANSGTNLTNYILPTSASGVGTISQKQLTAAISGDPTKTYDGATNAALASSDYTLTGFVGAQGATVNQTSGAYAAADAGSEAVSATLNAGNFSPNGGTILANYALPVSASGTGTINQKVLTATITGNPSKTYDGANNANLTASDFTLTGFVASQSATVTQTNGTYDSVNAGGRTVTASLGAGFFSANNGTNLSNYIMPAWATGAGTIDPRALTATITGDPTKIYDGSTTASLTPANYSLSGLVSADSLTVNQTSGSYDLADAGSRTITASLGAGNFTAANGTLLSNYSLPTSAAGAGTIDQKALTAAIINNPTKTYDATTAATLTSSNYSLTGFVGSQGAAVNQSAGSYASADAGNSTVTASFGSGNFTADSGTNLANYLLPTAASGIGTINQKAITAAITGDPTKTYDATTAAALAPSDYTLTGFVGSQGGTVSQTAGSYDIADAGPRTVSTSLNPANFTADSGTSLANYILPTAAAGAGTINQKSLSAAIVGQQNKTYDGTTDATLDASDYSLTGFIAGQGATVIQTAATYDSANAGTRTLNAQLNSSDFAANGGTNFANYVLPTNAAGAGTIDPRALSAIISGNPVKSYDGTSAASLSSNNFTLTGFVSGQSATVTQSAGAYDSSDAGSRTVAASLSASNFNAAQGTSLSNYVLPVAATGAGQINPALLTASIVNASKTYDSTNAAELSNSNYALSGFAAGQGASVIQVTGTYASPNAGAQPISAALAKSDFVANLGTNLANYVLPTNASGTGLILQKVLNAAISGSPSKVYDGNSTAQLSVGDYTLSGFVSGEGATINQTAGLYDSANAGARNVTMLLNASNFNAVSGTNLANYLLPVSASGAGTITPRVLSAELTGNPTKMNDGTLAAALSPANFLLSGFVSGQGATITQKLGQYDLVDAGSRTVTSVLSPQYFAANSGTLLSNYVLPATATGPGLITPAVNTTSPSLAAAISNNMTIRNLAPAQSVLETAIQTLIAAALPRTYIPYPAPAALSTWQNNGFGSLPAIIDVSNAAANGSSLSDGRQTVGSGAPIINSTEQILLQGGKNKTWKLTLPSSWNLKQDGRGH